MFVINTLKAVTVLIEPFGKRVNTRVSEASFPPVLK